MEWWSWGCQKYWRALITSASMAGRPIPDFENLGFKIASGLWKIQTRTRKQRSTREEITHRQTKCYDFFKIRGDNEAILDLGDLSNIQSENDNVQGFDAKWDEILSAVTDRPADNILETLQDASWKVGRIEILVAILHSNNDIWRQWSMTLADGSWWSKNISSRKARNRDEDRPAIGAPSKEKAKGKSKANAKKTPGDYIRWIIKANPHLEKHAHWSMTRRREGTTSFTFSDKFTAPKLEKWRTWSRWRKY